jgi:hypothetical protein
MEYSSFIPFSDVDERGLPFVAGVRSSYGVVVPVEESVGTEESPVVASAGIVVPESVGGTSVEAGSVAVGSAGVVMSAGVVSVPVASVVEPSGVGAVSVAASVDVSVVVASVAVVSLAGSVGTGSVDAGTTGS